MKNEKKYLQLPKVKKYKYKQFNQKRKIKRSILKNSHKINKIRFKFAYSKKSKKGQQKNELSKGKKIIRIFSNIISLILFIKAYYLYYLSLEKCLDGDDWCTQKWNWITLKLRELIISTIIIVVLIILII